MYNIVVSVVMVGSDFSAYPVLIIACVQMGLYEFALVHAFFLKTCAYTNTLMHTRVCREEIAHSGCVSGNTVQISHALSFTCAPKPETPTSWPEYQQKRVNLMGQTERGIFSAVHEAAALGSVSILSFLVHQAGVDVNAVTPQGNTPLHIAVYEGCDQAVEFLLSCGADASVKNHQGYSPLELAKGARLGLLGAGRDARQRLDESFRVLGVRPEAHPAELRARFRRLSQAALAALDENKGAACAADQLIRVCAAYDMILRGKGPKKHRTLEWARLFCRLELLGAELASDWVLSCCIPEERLRKLDVQEMVELGLPLDSAVQIHAALVATQGHEGLKHWVAVHGMPANLGDALIQAGVQSLQALLHTPEDKIKDLVHHVGLRRRLLLLLHKEKGKIKTQKMGSFGKVSAHTHVLAESSSAYASDAQGGASTLHRDTESKDAQTDARAAGTDNATPTGENATDGPESANTGTEEPVQNKQASAHYGEDAIRQRVETIIRAFRREGSLHAEMRDRTQKWRSKVRTLKDALCEAKQHIDDARKECADVKDKCTQAQKLLAERDGEIARLRAQLAALMGRDKGANHEIMMRVLDLEGALARAKTDAAAERDAAVTLRTALEQSRDETNAERIAASDAKGRLLQMYEIKAEMQQAMREAEEKAFMTKLLASWLYKTQAAYLHVLHSLDVIPHTVSVLAWRLDVAERKIVRMGGALAEERARSWRAGRRFREVVAAISKEHPYTPSRGMSAWDDSPRNHIRGPDSKFHSVKSRFAREESPRNHAGILEAKGGMDVREAKGSMDVREAKGGMDVREAKGGMDVREANGGMDASKRRHARDESPRRNVQGQETEASGNKRAYVREESPRNDYTSVEGKVSTSAGADSVRHQSPVSRLQGAGPQEQHTWSIPVQGTSPRSSVGSEGFSPQEDLIRGGNIEKHEGINATTTAHVPERASGHAQPHHVPATQDTRLDNALFGAEKRLLHGHDDGSWPDACVPEKEQPAEVTEEAVRPVDVIDSSTSDSGSPKNPATKPGMGDALTVPTVPTVPCSDSEAHVAYTVEHGGGHAREADLKHAPYSDKNSVAVPSRISITEIAPTITMPLNECDAKFAVLASSCLSERKEKPHVVRSLLLQGHENDDAAQQMTDKQATASDSSVHIPEIAQCAPDSAARNHGQQSPSNADGQQSPSFEAQKQTSQSQSLLEKIADGLQALEGASHPQEYSYPSDIEDLHACAQDDLAGVTLPLLVHDALDALGQRVFPTPARVPGARTMPLAELSDDGVITFMSGQMGSPHPQVLTQPWLVGSALKPTLPATVSDAQRQERDMDTPHLYERRDYVKLPNPAPHPHVVDVSVHTSLTPDASPHHEGAVSDVAHAHSSPRTTSENVSSGVGPLSRKATPHKHAIPRHVSSSPDHDHEGYATPNTTPVRNSSLLHLAEYMHQDLGAAPSVVQQQASLLQVTAAPHAGTSNPSVLMHANLPDDDDLAAIWDTPMVQPHVHVHVQPPVVQTTSMLTPRDSDMRRTGGHTPACAIDHMSTPTPRTSPPVPLHPSPRARPTTVSPKQVRAPTETFQTPRRKEAIEILGWLSSGVLQVDMRAYIYIYIYIYICMYV
jgi:hypothetical protein